ncbi:MAG: hypothetical protein ABJL44_07350 [Algibacter sp.]
MKKLLLITLALCYSTLTFSQSIPVIGDQYHLYGPNSAWGEYLKIGGNGRGTTNASVVSTNGNLHLDSKDGNALYLNHYSLGNTYINPQGGFVGIGTTEPLSKLHVFNGDNSYGTILANANESSFSLYAKTLTTQPIYAESFRLGLKHGTNENNGYISFFRGNDTFGGFLGFSTNGIERIRIDKEGDVGIGTTETYGYKLGVKGRIITEEVKVATYANWSDFVFAKDYNLPTLKEVEQHIKEKGHLENIPNAEAVKKDGFFLGEMDAKLLQKIEELTLYIINQEKRIETIEAKNEKLITLVEQLLDSKIEK